MVRTTKLYSEAQTFSSIDSEESDEANNGRPNLQGSLADTRWIEFALTDHKPLGCSVEESLASEPDGANYVFVSEVSCYCCSDLERLMNKLNFSFDIFQSPGG